MHIGTKSGSRSPVAHSCARCQPPTKAVIAATVLVSGAVGCGSALAALPNCTVSALNALGVPNMTVTAATDVPAANGVPEYCDLKGTVATNGEGAGPNTAGFEIDLPATWNHKFMFEGGGGFDGSLTPGTSQQLIKGYATASTDSGHTAPAGPILPVLNPSFAVISPGVVSEPELVDYFYRSRHQVAVAAKLLVRAYYGADAILYSYFSGCSNGGHEGFVEAIRYPNDFDGIISGDPWINQPGNEEWQLRNTKAFLKAWIPYSAGPAMNDAVMANCDAADGVVDGLIQNPAKCSFDPNTLVPATLTQDQADALKLYLEAVRDQNGRIIFPGASVSDIGELEPTGIPELPASITGIYQNELGTPAPDPLGPQPWGSLFTVTPGGWPLTDGVIAYLGYRDPSVNLISDLVVDDRGLVNDEAHRLLYKRLARGLANRGSMLLPFVSTGHKLLIYDGFSDPTLNPYETIRVYKELAGEVGGYHDAQESVRLFMVPGMQHCAGGIGPNVFDTLTPLEKWVEERQPPDGIIATHYVSNNPSLGADRTMPLCKFPEQARYSGSGNVNDAANWSCSQDDESLLELGPNGRQAGVDFRLDE